MMKKAISMALLSCLLLNGSVLAGLNSKKAAYHGGTTKDKDFPGAEKPVEGILHTNNEQNLIFEYELNKVKRTYSIPYKRIIDIEYGQKAGRRVGAAIATAILISPVGLFLLFSKKRKHFITIGYRDAEGKEQVTVFELGKDIVRTTLPILEVRSGKKIIYQDEEAKKSAKGS
ncbi:MAG: hypothetical protein RMM98_09015 [Acidobacteriota bacterium]|nr:hypothetical protein [Blastocatellia bacterium]MDW8239744.1 hypothetical protein [Acidobacteriota bacterium]